MTADEARDRIRARPELNAFISLTDEQGEGPMVAVKDLVDVRGTVTTGGGVILPATPALEDAPVVRRIREAGCTVVGKANLHEWAFGVTSANPHYGAVRNPHDPDRVAGGSSGGSAVAVATGMCDWAIGSDTGGSIRIPAALCGVVGFKPTIGSIETVGVIPLSRSLDTLGPLAPDVASAARALEAMSELAGLVPERPRPLSELRVAVAESWSEGLAPELAAAWKSATRGLPAVELGDPVAMGAAGLTILFVEAAAFHARWLERHADLYGPDVLQLLRRGQGISRHEYSMALLEQSRVRVQTESAMRDWDAVLTPATRIGAPRIGEEYDRADLTVYTRPFNTTGQPAITLPAPSPALPVGLQLVGHFGEEARLVEAALALEAAWRGH
jgi:Asp-tRNA(Asn)/Glu-tRNA(Gln) amidotransferase A subunit family amidase